MASEPPPLRELVAKQYRKFKVFHEPVEDSSVYPGTVSKFWYKLDEMKRIGIKNPKFIQCVDQLKKYKFSGWKRSRGDGNCYFRAVMYAYIDTILKPWNEHTLEPLITKIQAEQLICGQFPEYLEAQQRCVASLSELHAASRDYPVSTLIEFQRRMQNSQFDLDVVRCGRLMAASYFNHHHQDPDICAYLEGSAHDEIQEILAMGKEAGGIALMLLPLQLEFQVVQYNFFEERVAVQNFPEQEDFDGIVVSIVRRSGHYDILYQIQASENDQYCFETGEYHFISTEDND